MKRKKRRNSISAYYYLGISTLILTACGSPSLANLTHSNSSLASTQLRLVHVYPLNVRSAGTEYGVNFEVTDNLILLNQDGQVAYQSSLPSPYVFTSVSFANPTLVFAAGIDEAGASVALLIAKIWAENGICSTSLTLAMAGTQTYLSRIVPKVSSNSYPRVRI